MRVVLHLDWGDEVTATPPMRRRIAGFDLIKQRIAEERDEPVHLHAFTYAFLRRAKNIDLYIEADDQAIRDQLRDLRLAMADLETFERDGVDFVGENVTLRKVYLALRPVMVRPSARDERRALVHILMNGPCADRDLADDLGISENLAIRVRKALESVLTCDEQGRYAIQGDALPVVLFAVREKAGIDPLAALDR